MGKLYVIMGKSATGKDTIFHKLFDAEPKFGRIVPYTTRPIRSGETNGEEYYFCTEKKRESLYAKGKIIECRRYETIQGPWYYFTVDDGQFDFNSQDMIMISTLEGYEKLRDYFGKDKVLPIYIMVDDFTRMQRSLEREKGQKNPCVAEVCRRFLADEKDFSAEKLAAAGINSHIENNELDVCVMDIIDRIKLGLDKPN